MPLSAKDVWTLNLVFNMSVYHFSYLLLFKHKYLKKSSILLLMYQYICMQILFLYWLLCFFFGWTEIEICKFLFILFARIFCFLCKKNNWKSANISPVSYRNWNFGANSGYSIGSRGVLSLWFIWASGILISEFHNSRCIKPLNVCDLVVYNYIVYYFSYGTFILGPASKFLSSAIVFSDWGDGISETFYIIRKAIQWLFQNQFRLNLELIDACDFSIYYLYLQASIKFGSFISPHLENWSV